MPKLKLKPWQWILIVVFFVFFVNLGVLYINLMETRNMVSAREMIQLKHWVLTTLDNIPRYEKPPLPTWITAVFGAVFGFKSFVIMRLPAALMSLLTVWMVYKFVPLLKTSKNQAFISALIMATTFYLIFSGRTNQWDVYTHAFMMVSLFYGWKFLKHDNDLYKNSILSAVFFGFSFMSKGPISLYTLWLPFLLSYGIVYKYKDFKIRWKPLVLFLFIGFGIGLWWFIYVRLADPNSFIKTMSRESSRWGNYNVRPFYYYWKFFIQSGVWTVPALVGLLYPYLKNRVANKKAYRFVLFWTLFSVVLLSLVPEKKPRYLLPALIPLAMNTGFYIEYLFRKFKSLSIQENWIIYFNQSLIGLIGLAFPFVGYFILDLYGMFWFWYIVGGGTLFILGLLQFYFIRKKDFPKMFFLTIAMICAIMTLVFPLTNSFIKNPRANNIAKLHQLADKEGFTVYEFGDFAPQVIWEYGAPIPQIDREQLKIPSENRFGVIINDDQSYQKEKKDFLQKLKSDYKIVRQERYDVNYVPPKKHSYKDWLVRKFYLFEKK